jgi:hypothetical protein
MAILPGVRIATRAHDLEQQVYGPAGPTQEPPARPVLGGQHDRSALLAVVGRNGTSRPSRRASAVGRGSPEQLAEQRRSGRDLGI